MEEVGELARLIARHYGDQSFKPNENPNREALGEEMADILFVLLCLANQTGIDLEEAFHKKLALKNPAGCGPSRRAHRYEVRPFHSRLTPTRSPVGHR
jgi:NTP pyrophosphatase (non-canonical NTP hydrolase)